MSDVKSCLSCEYCVWDSEAVEYRCKRARPEFPDACRLHWESDHNKNEAKNER